jgi:hypothetical protein
MDTKISIDGKVKIEFNQEMIVPFDFAARRLEEASMKLENFDV